MRKAHLLFLAAALLGLSACSDDPAQPALGPITGQVVDADGAPVADAAILIEYELPPPSKPSTKLTVNIPEPGRIRLWITEPCSGETIRVLIDGEVDAGPQSVLWTGQDEDGLIVTSGVYRYHLTSADTTISRDMVLIHSGHAPDADPALYRHHAVTGLDGRFRIPQDCLPFGHTSEHTDEEGNTLGTFTISRTVQLFALHADHPTAASSWITVDRTTGADLTITLGD